MLAKPVAPPDSVSQSESVFLICCIDHQQEPPVPAAEGQQSRSGCTGRQSESRDTALHRPQGDVTFGESAVGTQSVGAVGSFQKVAEIIDQIGRTLHRHGENEAQQSDDRAEAAVSEGQGRSDENKDDGIPQTVRPDGQNPCGERVRFQVSERFGRI